MPKTAKGLTYPSLSDSPNVPRDMQLLAGDVDTLLDGYPTKAATTAEVAAAEGRATAVANTKAASDHTHASLPTTKMATGKAVLAINATGNVTITHGLGKTPTGCVLSVQAAATGNGGVVVQPVSYAATTITARVFNAAGAYFTSSSVTVTWVCW